MAIELLNGHVLFVLTKCFFAPVLLETTFKDPK